MVEKILQNNLCDEKKKHIFLAIKGNVITIESFNYA